MNSSKFYIMNKQMLKNSMTHGAIISLVLVTYAIIIYLLDINLYNPNTKYKFLSYFSYIIIALGIYFSTKNYRNTQLEGYIKYGQSLGYGTLTGVFSSIVYSLYVIVFFKFIDPDILQYIFDITEQQLIDNGLSSVEIDQAMQISKKIIFPSIVIGTVFGNTLVAFIFSLISSAFLKKNKIEE